jgi:NADP-dependent 3-hydroxy acid dehydrogenase YdfG
VINLSRARPNYACTHIATDFTQPVSIADAAAQIKTEHAELDAVVHCAGLTAVEEMEQMEPATMLRVMQVNVMGVVQLISGLFDLIKARSADILNVGSSVGTKAYEHLCAYGASKWALRGVSETLRLELKGTPCRVIQFNPGGFQSRLFEKATGIARETDHLMAPDDLAGLMLTLLELPKSVEVSDILVSRK